MLDSKLRRWPAVDCTAMLCLRDCWRLHLYRCERLQAFHSKSDQLHVLGVLLQYRKQACIGLHCDCCALPLWLSADNGPTSALHNSKMAISKHHAEHTVLSQGNSLGSHQAVLDIKAMRKAISAGFALTDQQVLAQAEQHHWVDGAVCAAAWIVDKTVFVANVGLQNYQLSMPCHVHHCFHVCMADVCSSVCSWLPLCCSGNV